MGRGFFRIGMIGLAAALCAVVWSIGVIAYHRLTPTVAIHFNGQWWDFPVNATDEQLKAAIEVADQRADTMDRIMNEEERGLPMATRIASARAWADLERVWHIDRAQHVALLALLFGVSWFVGSMRIVRGFLT
jgi:hypothetical protein